VVRTIEIAREIGCRGLLVHREDDAARNFYMHHVPAFEPSPANDVHLVLLFRDLRQAIA